MSAQETSQVLVALDTCLAAAPEEQSGALWRLAQRNRQLDANLVRLPAGASVAGHVESELDVLLIVVEGDGQLDNGTRAQPLEPGVVAWLPKSAHRALIAGPRGLAYLTVHRRRPGLSIGGRTAEEGGEAPCAPDRVCQACGRLRAEAGARFCSWCGEAVPGTRDP
ncbi:cupin domain-containing protein [Streptomyces decoyicus]|uniref:cupin domain-containing protein n=1 Tax=Streptomyces decoyicus TaxID=249567 RepID=UPI0033B41627